jgi:type IV secretion system protein VirB9
MKRAMLAFCLAGGLTGAFAADPRVVTATYARDRVYELHYQVGRAILIQFEPDEGLDLGKSTLAAIGDSEAWTLGERGNNVTLKPKAKLPQTNFILVTNKRTYFFDLSETRRGEVPTYGISFTYPDTLAAQAAARSARADAERVAEARRAQITAEAKARPVVINTDYVWRGTNELLKPSAAWDDGVLTRLEYDKSTELPVFYKVLPDGSEAIVDSNIDPQDKRIVILHEVIRKVRARLGAEVIEIVNKGFSVPDANMSGTDEHGAVRVEKGVTR